MAIRSCRLAIPRDKVKPGHIDHEASGAQGEAASRAVQIEASAPTTDIRRLVAHHGCEGRAITKQQIVLLADFETTKYQVNLLLNGL